MKSKKNKSVEVFGVRVDVVTMVEAEKLADGWMNGKGKQTKIVLTPNVEQVMGAQQDANFLDLLNRGDLNVCDSSGLKWGVNKLNKKNMSELEISERVAGVDLAERLVLKAAEGGKKVFLIGGAPTIAKKAVENLRAQMGNLEIMGVDGPANAINETETEWNETKKEIEKFKPSLLLVAFGAPAQEMWLMKHRDELSKLGVKVAMVVGGAVDMWAGEVSRAPLKWQENGLEWLWRLLHQPWRIGRQIKLVEFGWLIINSKGVI